MENTNLPPTNNPPVLPVALRARINQELHELKVISAFVDSRLESIEQFLNNFANQPNETNMNNLESDDESGETPLVSSFPYSDNDSDDEEVLKELNEYENVGTLRRERIINSSDRDDLAFECIIGFRKFTAYLDPFLSMNIISRKAYNTIMLEGLEGTGKNLVAIVRDVYVFVGSFTYITDFFILEDIREFIISDMAEWKDENPELCAGVVYIFAAVNYEVRKVYVVKLSFKGVGTYSLSFFRYFEFGRRLEDNTHDSGLIWRRQWAKTSDLHQTLLKNFSTVAMEKALQIQRDASKRWNKRRQKIQRWPSKAPTLALSISIFSLRTRHDLKMTPS
ncbi:hypothetical protein Tco_1112526 [Tanacetum coccineum]|uniref:Uncharacterized protein n=1 Tax=Tanacetum coccineum TaxID=301880 RepID=A0ABQ5ISC3_9ASTR